MLFKSVRFSCVKLWYCLWKKKKKRENLFKKKTALRLTGQTSLLSSVFLLSKSLLKSCKNWTYNVCLGYSIIILFQKISKLPQQKGLEFPEGGGRFEGSERTMHKFNWNFQRAGRKSTFCKGDTDVFWNPPLSSVTLYLQLKHILETIVTKWRGAAVKNFDFI